MTPEQFAEWDRRMQGMELAVCRLQANQDLQMEMLWALGAHHGLGWAAAEWEQRRRERTGFWIERLAGVPPGRPIDGPVPPLSAAGKS